LLVLIYPPSRREEKRREEKRREEKRREEKRKRREEKRKRKVEDGPLPAPSLISLRMGLKDAEDQKKTRFLENQTCSQRMHFLRRGGKKRRRNEQRKKTENNRE
jgi:hypothetical protein